MRATALIWAVAAVLLAAALPATVARSAGTGPQARASADVLHETLTVTRPPFGSPASAYQTTSTTVLGAGSTYRIVVSGAVSQYYSGQTIDIDALYCFRNVNTPPSFGSCTPPRRGTPLRFAIGGGTAAELDKLAGYAGPLLGYAADHRYEVTVTAPETGPLVVSQLVGLIDSATGAWTVEVYGAAPDDSDGDGLSDDWEMRGVDTDGDGKIDLDLPRMGADPKHKDLFVEVDYMKPHNLEQAAIDIVVSSFANAPVANPDGRTGITLHADSGPRSTMNPVTGTRWGRSSGASQVPHKAVLGKEPGGKYDWSEFDAIKSRSFSARRRSVFRYVLSIHQAPGAAGGPAGLARGIPASDFIVSLGRKRGGMEVMAEGTNGQAATFMHELGHTLGLRHGGDSDDLTKPNYLSIMSYLYSTAGLSPTGPNPLIDYSRFSATTAGGTVADLNEAALSEDAGLVATGGAAKHRFAYLCPADFLIPSRGPSPVNTAVDWNCNGARDRPAATCRDPITGNLGGCSIDGKSEITTIKSFDDWSFLARRSLRPPGASGARSAASAWGAVSGLPPAGRSSLATDKTDPVPLKTLHRIAQVVRRDSRRPRVKIALRRAAGGRARLKVTARDNRALDQLLVLVDRRRQTVLPKRRAGSPKRTRVLSYGARLRRGRHVIRALAVDQTSNLSKPIKRRVRIHG